MRFFSVLTIGALLATGGLCLEAQNAPAREAQPETRGIPPRAAPTDYLSHTQAGAVTLAAEFKGHSVPTLQSPLTTEDYVAVEVALYGAAEAKAMLSANDFSLRINGKKQPLASQPYGLVASSLRDPEWEPPDSGKSKSSKTSIGGGGQGESSEPKTPPKVPIELQRAWAQRVQQAALPEGDRPLPQAGLLFFQYRGKTSGIRSVELIYAGPAGKATLPLEP